MRIWLWPSLHHRAFMHAILSLSTLQLALIQPSNTAYLFAVLDHRSKAISAVQVNLVDMNTAISDENIGAVFNLLCVELNIHLPAFAVLSGLQIRPDRIPTSTRSVMAFYTQALLLGLMGCEYEADSVSCRAPT